MTLHDPVPLLPSEPVDPALPADIVALVDTALRRDPTNTAVIFDDGVVITVGELRHAIEGLAGWMSHKIQPGDRVVAMCTNRVEMMVAWVATAAAGGLFVSVNHAAGTVDATHVMADADPVVAIGEAGTVGVLADALRAAGCEAEIAIIDGPEPFGLAHLCLGDPLPLRSVAVDGTAPVSVYYTSGTTGLPKGCVLGHDYWLWFVHRWLTLFGMGPDDRLLCCLQFFYGDPPWQFLASLHVGAPWVVMRRFSVSRFWDVVRDNRVTQLMTLASIPSLLATAEPSLEDRNHAVRFAVQIGVPVAEHASMVERWGFPWLDAYGLTESGLATAVRLASADDVVGTGSLGPAVPGAEIRCIDGNGREVPSAVGDDSSHSGPGPVGELLLKVPGMFRGYLGKPEATAEMFIDGWMRTGDLAWRDAAGHYHFAGRSKDVVRRSGENVSAQEVEAVLRSHPLVTEAAVVAVPDALRGEEVKAHVAFVEGHALTDQVRRDVVAWCADRLSPHKVPRYIETRTEPFERTPSMRVRKVHLNRDAVGDLIWDRNQEEK